MGFTTGIEETMHITWIKNVFKQTNMRKSYKRQILNHNVEKFSLIVSDNIDLFLSTKIPIQANKNSVLQINSMSGTKKIREDLRWYIERNEQVKLQHS